MKQIALDIGLTTAPAFGNFFTGPNHAAMSHLQGIDFAGCETFAGQQVAAREDRGERDGLGH